MHRRLVLATFVTAVLLAETAQLQNRLLGGLGGYSGGLGFFGQPGSYGQGFYSGGSYGGGGQFGGGIYYGGYPCRYYQAGPYFGPFGNTIAEMKPLLALLVCLPAFLAQSSDTETEATTVKPDNMPSAFGFGRTQNMVGNNGYSGIVFATGTRGFPGGNRYTGTNWGGNRFNTGNAYPTGNSGNRYTNGVWGGNSNMGGNGGYPNGNGVYPTGNGGYPNGNGRYPNGNGVYPNGNGVYPNGNGVYPNGNGAYMGSSGQGNTNGNAVNSGGTTNQGNGNNSNFCLDEGGYCNPDNNKRPCCQGTTCERSSRRCRKSKSNGVGGNSGSAWGSNNVGGGNAFNRFFG